MAVELPVTQIDGHPVPDVPGEIRLFSCMRNEVRRLPFFLRHYRQLGVNRFFVINHGSTDGTAEYLLDEEQVHVFTADGSFAATKCGIEWTRYLLTTYGTGHWCVVVDADELLAYPYAESLSLRQLTQYLGAFSYDAMYCVLLDMYSDKAFCDTHVDRDQSLQTACPYYEVASISRLGQRLPPLSPTPHLRNGMRSRVFSLSCALDKVSLFRQRDGVCIREGMHVIQGATVADVTGVTLHYKYLSDFTDRSRVEAQRGEHWNRALEPKRYFEVMTGNPRLSAYSDTSLCMRTSVDLIASGVLRCPLQFTDFFGIPPAVEEPRNGLWVDANN